MSGAAPGPAPSRTGDRGGSPPPKRSDSTDERQDEEWLDLRTRNSWERPHDDPDLIRFIGVFAASDHHIRDASGDEMAYVAFAFEARAVGGALAADGRENLEARYVTREEAFRRDLWPPARLALPIVFSGGDRVYFDAPAPPTA